MDVQEIVRVSVVGIVLRPVMTHVIIIVVVVLQDVALADVAVIVVLAVLIIVQQVVVVVEDDVETVIKSILYGRTNKRKFPTLGRRCS